MGTRWSCAKVLLDYIPEINPRTIVPNHNRYMVWHASLLPVIIAQRSCLDGVEGYVDVLQKIMQWLGGKLKDARGIVSAGASGVGFKCRYKNRILFQIVAGITAFLLFRSQPN
ncbi:hypothetical protein BUE76_22615 [Cnuella takakiae]|nr:hypothetical protein BUE76_22615 [Cnuella takakiae]